MRTVLLGYGNPSRGDDALGPRLLERAEAWLRRHPDADIVPIADFQLQIEHVLDLQGHDLALFLDADVCCDAPFQFCSLRAARDDSYSTHELSPEALLHVLAQTVPGAAPLAFALRVRGYRFELGEPVSAEAAAGLFSAGRFLEVLLADARPDAWTRLATKAVIE